MNQVLTKTQEAIAHPEYPPEVGNLAGVLGLSYPGAAYGIVTEVDDSQAFIGVYLVKITWFAPKRTRKRAHQENQRSNAARRVAVCDRLDVVNKHYAEVQQ